MSEYPVGLLWQGEGRDWREEVRAAAAAYQTKFWIPADACFLRRETIQADSETVTVTVNLNGDPTLIGDVDGVAVYASDHYPKNHFFVFNSRVVDPRKARKGAEGQRSRGAGEPVELVQGGLF